MTPAIQVFGTLGFALLHAALTAGWMGRVRLRRQLGLATFLCGFVHGAISVAVYHASGNMNPVASLFAVHSYQLVGFAAAAVLLFVPAARVQAAVLYGAYLLVAAHVAMGPLRDWMAPAESGGEGVYERGQYREYAGELILSPYPMLWSGNVGYLLAGPGKRGVAELVRGHDGDGMRVRGALIRRGDWRMLEIEPESVAFSERPRVSLFRYRKELGVETLRGEIVASKCFLGAMKPGRGAVHRDCAVRSISGGVPAMFVAGERVLLLTGPRVLQHVGATVTVTGRVVRTEAAEVLEVESYAGM